MTSLNDIKDNLDNLSAESRILHSDLVKFTAEYEKCSKKLLEYDDLQELFQTASKLMYDNLSIKLGQVITEGLTIMFPEAQYTFTTEFVERRGTIEADLYLIDSDGNRYHPLDAVGGGVADFVSILLRCTYIILSQYDNTLIADEPLKYIDRDNIVLGASFVSKFCKDFNFQILMITHIPEIVELAASVYQVHKSNKISKILKKK